MFGAIGIFTRNPVLSKLFAARKVILNPNVIFDLALENLRRITRVLIKVLPLGNDSRTHDIVLHRNIPKPTAIIQVGNRSRSFIQTGISLGTFE